ncbi:MAG: lipocalin family protein [Melioribacteraceae bacterium]
MKKLNFIYIIVILFAAIIISCSDDKSSTEPELVVDPALVGTWELTKIIANLGTTNLELTPEQAGYNVTAIFRDDLTLESTTVNGDSTTIDTGTWGTKDGVLTLALDGEEPETSPYAIEGNVATIESTVPYQGFEIDATLEFTKQ